MSLAKERLENLVRWSGEGKRLGEIAEPFFPVLKPARWAQGGDLVTRPLAAHLSLPADTPVVGYALDFDESVVFVNRGDLPELLADEDIHRIALDCLRTRLAEEAQFQLLDAESCKGLGTPLLAFTESYYAAEGILLPQVLSEAAQRLNADAILAAVPARGQLVMIDADVDREILARFAYVVSGFHHQSDQAPIATQLFRVENGQIVGHLAGTDEVVERAAARAREEEQSSPQVTIARGKKTDPDGETVILRFSHPDPMTTFERVQHAVHRTMSERANDRTLSGRIEVIVDVSEERRAAQAELATAAADLEDFLNRQIAQFGFGPRPDQRFIISLALNWRNEWKEAPVPEEVDKRSFTEEEWALLADAPYLVFLAVAAADGKIDKKEAQVFQATLLTGVQSGPPIVQDMFAASLRDPVARLQKLASGGVHPVETLKRIGALLSEKMPEETANGVKLVLLAVGKAVAEASGGFLGFGKKISKEEEQALAAVFVCLGMQLE